MVTRIMYIVFVLPVVLSVAFSSMVLAEILQEPDRELNLWPSPSTNPKISEGKSIEIIGLKKQYSTSSPISIQVKIDDPSFDCGDLYITILHTIDNVVFSQTGFFEQCFGKNHEFLPINDNFSEIVDIPGQYQITVKMSDQDQKNSITASGKFIIK